MYFFYAEQDITIEYNDPYYPYEKDLTLELTKGENEVDINEDELNSILIFNPDLIMNGTFRWSKVREQATAEKKSDRKKA